MNGQVNINTNELNSAISILSSTSSTLENDAISAITSDFAPLTSVGLFTSGLESIKSAIETLINNQKQFIASLQAHLSAMEQQENQIDDFINSYSTGPRTSTGPATTSSSSYDDSNIGDQDDGKKINTADVTASINEITYETAKTWLANIAAKAKEYGTTITELLLNPEKSGLLYEILKKILGDTDANIDTTSTADTNNIQKILLAKLSGLDKNAFASLSESSILKCMTYLTEFAKNKGITVTDLLFDSSNNAKYLIALRNLYDGRATGDYTPTEEETKAAKEYIDAIAKKEGKTVDNLLSSSSNADKLKEFTETKVIKKSGTQTGQGSQGESVVDTSNLPKTGEHTSTWETQGEKWTVATTKASLPSYASYVKGKISQDSNTAEFGDKCLSFAETHAYALYTGNTGDSAARASAYPHSGAFTSFINDSKTETLKKIYSEIMNGRPVVVQVNGNKQGTSRHFVTVVGFKSSVTDPSQLTEKDLLIIDSWDGKTERMDGANSRFFTSGADCHKSYSGYYLRVLKA